MKKRNFIATIIVALVGVSIISACTKEETPLSNESSDKVSYSSSLEESGLAHNNLLGTLGDMIKIDLDSCAVLINNGNFTEDDEIRMCQVIMDTLTKIFTQTTFYPIAEDSVSYVFGEVENVLTDDFWNNDFSGSASEHVLSGILTNNSNATDIYSIIQDVRFAENNIEVFSMSHEDSLLLANLVIFRYSLNYWYDAYVNEENPWHNVVSSLVSNCCYGVAKNVFRKAWQWIRSKVVEPVLAVAAVTATCDLLAASSFIVSPATPYLDAAITAVSSAIGLIGSVRKITSNN